MGRTMRLAHAALVPIVAFSGALVLAGSAAGLAPAFEARPATQLEGDVNAASAAASLGGCDQADVAVQATTLPPSSISQAQAEHSATIIGATGHAAIAIPALVTAGTVAGQAPTVATILKDVRGIPISARPSWVLVFTGQDAPAPAGFGGGAHRLASLAAIIDAASGEMIRGWGCAWKTG